MVSVINNRSKHVVENIHISVKLYRIIAMLWDDRCEVWSYCSDYHSVRNKMMCTRMSHPTQVHAPTRRLHLAAWNNW